MAQKIYFDESGFTGNNLLHEKQKYFSYGSVATDDEESKDFVEYLIRKYNIQNGELKGGKLVNSSKGQNAIDEILSTFKGRVRSVVSDKKYALAGKYFEYVFEPAISEKNSIFYDLNFHLFIANYLHVELTAKEESAEILHNDFELMMRSQKNIEEFFSVPSRKEEKLTQVFNDIIDFTAHNKESIKSELESLEGTGTQKWVLDLTTTSLYNLLADWGQHYEKLCAVCDSSKPLAENRDHYNAMIGFNKKEFQTIRGEEIPLTFNLEKEISFSDSKTTHGIQIADVIAATSIYILNSENSTNKYYKKWLRQFEESIFYWQCCVVPSYENLDLSKIETIRNCYLLSELANRSKKGTSLLDGIEKDIMHIDRSLRRYIYS